MLYPKIILILSFFISCIWAQDIHISGSVRDGGGDPLEGATVKLVSSGISDITGLDGTYSLTGTTDLIKSNRQEQLKRWSISYRNGTFSLNTSLPQTVKVRLFDLAGKLVRTVFQGTLKPGVTRVRTRLESSSGMYLLAVSTDNGLFTYKVICGLQNSVGFSKMPGSSIGGIRKKSALDILQAYKSGYEVYIQDVDAFTDTIDITLNGVAASDPVLGPNVNIYDEEMNMGTIQSRIDSIWEEQRGNEFGPNRCALLFKPGTYDINVKVSYYTQAAGLGLLPGGVQINGVVESLDEGHSSLINFWRSVENMKADCNGETNNWIVSQAAPFRRMHIVGDMALSGSGSTSGGFIADSKIEGTISSGSQQQFMLRNTNIQYWSGGVWNMFFIGVDNPPYGSWPEQPYTKIDQVPVVKDKSFLYIADDGSWNVFVPDFRQNTTGPSWESGNVEGKSLPLDLFYIAHDDTDNDSSINAALASGRHLLFTPGKYYLDSSITITNPGTVVLGIGLPSLIPENGNIAMKVSDVDNVSICGITLDAGTQNSPTLLEMGPEGSSADHSGSPSMLSDVFCRIGTTEPGNTGSCVTINSNDVVADHFWLWRADHGPSAYDGRPGWEVNKCANGLIVNGDDVTIYGLFNEHNREYQTLWNGNGGRTYFYQCETPYDAEESWAHDGINGYAAYKVTDEVTTHEAWAMGIYLFFDPGPLDNAVEVPQAPGVKMHNIFTFGEISHVINGVGGPGSDRVMEYP